MKRILVVLAFWAMGCENQPQQEKRKSFCLDENFKNKIEFYTTRLEEVVEGTHLTGSIIANPEKVVEYRPLWEGTVVKTYFTLGDKVSKGQLLAEIRSTEGNTLQATLSSLESRIKAAERKKENLKHLLADGMASQTELEEAIADLEVLKSEKVRAQTESKWNHSQEGYFKVYAPTSGVVTEKSINIGEQVVAGGEPMFVISDLEDLWLMLNIYASNVQRIQEGMEVSISTLSFPGELFSGRITKISPAFDEDARVLKARSTFENRGGRLKPGMTVDVTAWKKAGESAVAVPVSALVFSDNQYYVLVHHSDCKVEVRKVEIAVKNKEKAYLSGGLSEGEKIISKNQLLVFEAL